MSGLLAVIGPVRDSRVDRALAPLRYLGGDREQVWSEQDTLVAVTRKEWQLADDFSGPVLVLDGPDAVVAADASLFDKKGLARKLSTAGVKARGDTPSHFIEAAYRAWGPALVEHLNGDYAFVIWDRRERRLMAARDPIGGRPLFWTRTATGVAVASSCRALAELRDGVQDLNLSSLGAQVAGFAWANGSDTAFRGIDTVLPGRRLTWVSGSLHLEPFWRPREAPHRRPTGADAAAEELRELLTTAVSQRLESGTTTVWMSGGWDSTAVFAAGQNGLTGADRGRLRPVSISYPPGDPGREDEFIGKVSDRWAAPVHWIQSDDLQLLEGLEDRAGGFDEPPAHLYELWNRGLARGTRALGSRTALDGCGGDQLFQVSDIILADLLRAGRWVEFSRLARRRRGLGWKHVVRAGVLPWVPDVVLGLAERVAGRRIPRHYMERPAAGWVRQEFASAERLRERDLSFLRSVRSSSRAHEESLLYLSMPLWGWGAAFMRGPLLEEGVEVRSPLLDLKVVDFALGRPVSERFSGSDSKLLLRRSMEGLLPAEVLAPRTRRTGTTVGFSRRRMIEAYPRLIARLFSEPLRLCELGIVDSAALRSAADRYLAGEGGEYLRVQLFHTMKIEFWLRSLERRSAILAPPAEGVSAAVEIPAA